MADQVQVGGPLVVGLIEASDLRCRCERYRSGTAAPIDEITGTPTGFTLDAVLEIYEDLKLPERADPRLIDPRGADVPKPRSRDGILATGGGMTRV